MENLQEHLVLSPSSACSSTTNPHLMSITAECWSITKLTTQEILCAIQPTIVSERRRKEIIDYIRGLIWDSFGYEVLPFGSMPLKTYLPDGDIDLTALCPEDDEEDFARYLCTIFESERQMDSEFRVENISYIQAKVKIVKCMVQDVSVDISFNQTGGLSTLCFLEQIDILIGKDHLFKRSVILIKAWCYYEGQILGSHCGLLATYALEILILHVINLFYPTLFCPLAVLYRFLDYYQTFDWETFGVSVLGPVSISSLLTGAQAEETADKPLLIGTDFLRRCKEAFSVPTQASEGTGQPFLGKYINIQDPLRDYNNLGRSISLGKSYQFRSAISVGAEKLKEILMLPEGRINDALKEFFNNTLDRNGGGQGAEEGGVVPFRTGSSKFCSLQGDYYSYLRNLQYGRFYHANNLSSFSLDPGSFGVPFQWMYSNQSYVPWGYEDDFASMLPSQNTNEFFSPSSQSEEQESNMNGYFPSLSFWPEAASQLPRLAYPFERKASKGTGTFIPDVALIFRNDSSRWECEQEPEHELRSGIPHTSRWEIKKPEQMGEKDSEPALHGLLPKPEDEARMISKLKNPEDEARMISKLKNRIPSFQREEEGRKDSEPALQGLLPKPEDEGRMISRLKNRIPSVKPEEEGRKDSEPALRGLLPKPEDEGRLVSKLKNRIPFFKPEEKGIKDSEPTLRGLLPKHKDKEGVISKWNNLAPSLKPVQERQRNQKSKAQGMILKPEFESSRSSQEAKEPDPVLETEPGRVENGVSAQGLLLKPEDKQRNSLNPESSSGGPSMESPPENYDQIEVAPETKQNQPREAVITNGYLYSLEEFPELPHKVKQDSSLDPKDSEKELVPDQLYSLADDSDFPPLGSKPKGKGKSQRKKNDK